MSPTENTNLHVFFLPYFATSHIIPLVDIARLFALRNINVAIATTPANAALFEKTIEPYSNITLLTIPFPASEVGLSPGIENFGHVTSIEQAEKVGYGIHLLQKPMEQLIRDSNPDCIISDMFFPWTVELAEELNVPRIVWHGSNCFNLCASHSIKVHSPHTALLDAEDHFIIPNLPDEITMKMSQLEDYMKSPTSYGELLNMTIEADKKSFGVVFTNYREFEPAYVDHFKNVVGQKCWSLGFPSDFITSITKIEPKILIPKERHNILKWLDDREPNSVLYVCFGSMAQLPGKQLREMASALENSGRPFVWVVRKQGENEEEFLPKGFESRIKESNRGLIVREWAPQREILCHIAVGGFMTHCGWNSLLEAIISGVPMVTWPLFAEHHYNEMLITKVMKIGVAVGADEWNPTFEIKSKIVGNDKVVKAVNRLMDQSEEAGEFRQRAKEYSSVAKKAMEENGSAWCDLDRLIADIKSFGKET